MAAQSLGSVKVLVQPLKFSFEAMAPTRSVVGDTAVWPR